MFTRTFNFLIVILLINKSTSQHKLNIEILFESLCPDSVKFIGEQLHPAWKDIAPYVNLKLVPFGKSNSINGGSSFVCQHGARECKGNRLMSCGLTSTGDSTAQVEFVNCFMRKFYGSTNEFETTKHCASIAGLPFEKIHECYRSSLGTSLQLEAEQYTLVFKPQFVPTILINGQFVQQIQDASITDFKGYICSVLKQTHPEACSYQSTVHL